MSVSPDDSVVGANESVSLGLVVTELVINALKYAFPNQRPGTIAIDYRSLGPNWQLSVKDDGVGMPIGENKPKPGLGTGIIAAISRQLGSAVRIVDGNPGAAVTLVYDEATGSDSDLPAAA